MSLATKSRLGNYTEFSRKAARLVTSRSFAVSIEPPHVRVIVGLQSVGRRNLPRGARYVSIRLSSARVSVPRYESMYLTAVILIYGVCRERPISCGIRLLQF